MGESAGTEKESKTCLGNNDVIYTNLDSSKQHQSRERQLCPTSSQILVQKKETETKGPKKNTETNVVEKWNELY